MENIVQLLIEISKAVKKPQEEVGYISPHSHTSSSTTFLPIPLKVEKDYQSVHRTALKRSREVLDEYNDSESNLRSFILSHAGYSLKKKARWATGGRGHCVSKSLFVEEKLGGSVPHRQILHEWYKPQTAMKHSVLKRGG